MFYELGDYDYNSKKVEYHLINLDEVLQINKLPEPVKIRDDETGKVKEYYKIKIYYTGKGNEWGFYYQCERDRDQAYDGIKKALKIYIDRKTDIDEVITDTINAIEKNFHPLEDLLNDPPLEDIPEVKY